MASPWEALGRPPLAAAIPGPRSPTWARARQAFRAALRGAGADIRLRSPGTVWRTLAGTPCRRGPPGLTSARWARSRTCCGSPGPGAGRKASAAQPGTCVGSSAPHTDRAAAKRAVVVRALQAGHIVLLQETHWTEAAAAQWGGLFPAVEVRHSAARAGPRGGPQGGVAVLVPRPHRVVADRVLVAGCALEVTVALGAT